MSTNTVTTVSCDLCKIHIKHGEQYVSAGVYGVDAHIHCFNKLTVFEVLGFLSLDDIDIDVLGSSTDVRKRALERINYGKFAQLP